MRTGPFARSGLLCCKALAIERVTDHAHLSPPPGASGDGAPSRFVEAAGLLARGLIRESNRIRFGALGFALAPDTASDAREVRRGPPQSVDRRARRSGIADLRPAIDAEPAAVIVDIYSAVVGLADPARAVRAIAVVGPTRAAFLAVGYATRRADLPVPVDVTRILRHGGDDEPAARIGFKHPLSFIPIKSYFDRLSGDEEEIGLQLQHRSSTPSCRLARLAMIRSIHCNGGRSRGRSSSMLLALCSEKWLARWRSMRLPSSKAGFKRSTRGFHEWWEQARRQPALRLCDTSARKWFNGEWQWLRATVENSKKILEWRLDLDSVPYHVTHLTCCTFAAHSQKAAKLIPSALVRAYENDTRRDADGISTSPEPIHQMLGYGASVQWAPTEHLDDVLLLQIAGEPQLAWFNTGGCVLLIWISQQALGAGRFEPTIQR